MNWSNAHFEHLSRRVKLGKNVFLAPNAVVIGDVELGDNVSVWYQAVIRADHDRIIIGENTNVQDGTVFHVDEGVPVRVGANCVIGHAAIVHGATIGDGCLIGMRATIMNHAKVGKGCIIGAHALVTEGMEVPDFCLVLGTPGKVIKQLPDDQVADIQSGVRTYKAEALRYLSGHGG